MQLTIATEQRFQRLPDGSVWAESGLGADFWHAYLEVFDPIRVVARMREVQEPIGGGVRSDEVGVIFEGLPYYRGVWQFIRKESETRRIIRRAAMEVQACIIRAPSPVGGALAKAVTNRHRPYGVEVVGDPEDVFAPGANVHPLRPLMRYGLAMQLRQVCEHACVASYVTETSLQAKYPCAGRSYSISSIRLGDDAFVSRPRTYASPGSRLVFVGSLEQPYKGLDVLLHALAALMANGRSLQLEVIGDGVLLKHYERVAARLGLSPRVKFTGWLPPGEAVRDRLRGNDLLVHPSRTEGLPRALIEAMALGLPCVGTRVGGVPELLPQEDLAIPGDVSSLAGAIEAMVSDPARMALKSASNLETARRYAAELLGPRRRAFLEEVREHAAILRPAGRQ